MFMMVDNEDPMLVDSDLTDLPEFDFSDENDNCILSEISSSKVILQEWRDCSSPFELMDEVADFMQIDVQDGDLLDPNLFLDDSSICLSPTSALDNLEFSSAPLDEKELILFDYPGEKKPQDPPGPNINPGIPVPPPSMPFSDSGTFDKAPVSKRKSWTTSAAPKSSIKPKLRANTFTSTLSRSTPKTKPRKPIKNPSAPLKTPAQAHAAAQAYAQYYPPPYPQHSHYAYSKYSQPPHSNYNYVPHPGSASTKASNNGENTVKTSIPTSKTPSSSTPSTATGDPKVLMATPVTDTPLKKTVAVARSHSASSATSRPSKVRANPKESTQSAPSSPRPAKDPSKEIVASYEEHYRQMRKLSESMSRSQETRRCFHMQTDKTEEYDREKALKILSSSEQSTFRLQHYLCGGHSKPFTSYSSHYSSQTSKPKTAASSVCAPGCTKAVAATQSNPIAAQVSQQERNQ